MNGMNEVIRARRRALGMTQEEVARRLGVSAPAVSKWEQGASCPDVTLLPALARRDRAESIAHIRGMLEALKRPWSPGADTPIADVKAVSNPDMLGGILRELEESEEYAFLRGDEEFTALLAAHRKRA